MRDTMERIERAPTRTTRRGLVLALLTGLKQICNHPAHFLKQSDGAAGRALREARPARRAARHGAGRGRRGAGLHPVRRDGAAARGAPGRAPACPTSSCTAAPRCASARRWCARFQAGRARPPVFLLSLKAGGTGLNLTRADHVVHFDRWWNPAVEEQATDRAYRIGQTRPVQVHRLVTQGTIEERIAELLTRKRALADAVLARGEAALTELEQRRAARPGHLRREPAGRRRGRG